MMRPLVVDANILISAVLGTKVFELMKQYRDKVRFVTPEVCFGDARKYLPPLLMEKARLTTTEAINLLLAWVEPIETTILLPFENSARQLLHRRDPDDWPVLAAAWALGAPIWTQDQDFFGLGVATWTSANVVHYLKGTDFSQMLPD